MSGSIVSDSEDEAETFDLSDISQVLLQSEIRRMSTESSIHIKHTNTINETLRSLIEGYIHTLRYNQTHSVSPLLDHQDETSTTEPSVHDQVLSQNIPSVPENVEQYIADNDVLSDVQALNRSSSRRRNVSFHQQHIFTIDSVAYILKISPQQATELVRNKPELIDYYHNGSLRSFLSRGMRKSKGDSTSKKQTMRSDAHHQTPENSQLHHEGLQNLSSSAEDSSDSGEFTSDDSASSEDDSEEEDDSQELIHVSRQRTTHITEEESQPENELVKVKGRTYKGLEALSRGSKLPKSFFALERSKKSSMDKANSKRSRVEETERAGLAKKKKSLHQSGAIHSVSSIDDNIFTVVGDSQDSAGTQPGDMSDHISSNDFLVIESNASQGLSSDKHTNGTVEIDDDLMIFEPNESQRMAFYRTSNNNIQNWDVEEDKNSGVDYMLASSSTRKAKHSTKNGGDKPAKFRRTPATPSRVSKSRPQKSKASEPKKSYTKQKSRYDTKHNEENKPTSHLQRQINIYDFTIDGEYDHNGEVETSERPVVKTKKIKKKKTPLFFLEPNENSVLPRPASSSSTVYEGLSDKFAFVNRKVTPRPQIVEQNPGPQNLAEDVPSKFNQHFSNSNAYKRLFTTEKVESKLEYRIVIGTKLITFTKLNSNFQESIHKLFQLLLDPSSIRNMTNENLVESLIEVIEFCTFLETSNIKSLIYMVNDFKFQVDADIKRKGHIKDIQFYYLSFCYMLYYTCFKVYETNYLNLFNFKEKAQEIVTTYFEYASFIDSSILKNKLSSGQMLFFESLSMLFLVEKNLTWAAYENSTMDDMDLLKKLSLLFRPEQPLWSKLRKIVSQHSERGRSFELRNAFKLVDELVHHFNWKLDEKILVTMYECLKKNRFKNFHDESGHPVIFSPENRINKDTSLNIYLNLLLIYSIDTKPSLKLLEKIMPVSKLESMDVVLFCNRTNLLLVLSFIYKKNFEARISQVFSSCEFRNSKVITQKALRAVQVLISINNSNNHVTKLGFLTKLLEDVLDVRELESWDGFIKTLNLKTLHTKTQQNLIAVLSNFKNNKNIISSSTGIIKEYISGSPEKSTLVFIKDKLGDLNSSMFPELWCFISGVLVRRDMENWGRLIHFNNFDDEVYIFTYILRHSGAKIYKLEKDTFLSCVLKNVVKRKTSTSLNLFLRELEKVDHDLFNTKNLSIQVHKLQITINLISCLLKGNALNSTTRYISLIVNFLKLENGLSTRDSDVKYSDYVKKVIEFINVYASQFVGQSSAFEQLCHELKVSRKTSSIEENQLIDFKVGIQENMRVMESKLIGSVSDGSDFSKMFVKVLLRYNSHKFGDSDLISDSKLYSICCVLSVHVELLKFLPSCWILLKEISKTILDVLLSENNLSRVDYYCVLKTISLFQFMLLERNSRFLEYELLTLTNIFKIFKRIYLLLSGNNDMSIFIEITLPFLSRDVLSDNYGTLQLPKYIIKAPNFLQDMIVKANLTSDGKQYSTHELKKDMEVAFNEFVELIDDFYEPSTHELYIDNT